MTRGDPVAADGLDTPTPHPSGSEDPVIPARHLAGFVRFVCFNRRMTRMKKCGQA